MTFIDCFVFNNELDLLELRLRELADHVALFVLVESDKTFSGRFKGFNFDPLDKRWDKWRDKIFVERVTDMPGGSQARDHWEREYHQRNCILRALMKIRRSRFFTHWTLPSENYESVPVYAVPQMNNATILLSDVDEIPRPSELQIIAPNSPMMHVYEQDFFYYHFNCECEHKWYGTKACSFSTMMRLRPEGVRQALKFTAYSPYEIISNGGWHFSHFGGIYTIRKKLMAGAHQEYNAEEFTDTFNIEKRVKGYGDLFDRHTMKFHHRELDSQYPQSLLADRGRWSEHFASEDVHAH